MKDKMKTREEVNDLKRQWTADPCWDLEDTEGFEDYREVLYKYQATKWNEWHQAAEENVLKKADDLQISPDLAAYIISLEKRLKKMERRIDELNGMPF